MYGPIIYFTIKSDKDFSGRLEAKVSLLGQEENAIYFHQKSGQNQGHASYDWSALR